MFNVVKDDKKKRAQEIQNMKLREKLINAEANIDYLSMMSDIDTPSDESTNEPTKEGGADNE